MFRVSSCALAAAAAFLMLGTASAQSKVAIINLQRAVVDTAEIKKAQGELEAKYKGRADELAKLQKELEGLQQQLQAMQGKLTPQAEQELVGQGQRKQRELQRKTEDLQGDVDRERNEVLQRAGSRLQEVVKKLSEERGYDMVVDVSNTIYFKPALDITADAVAAYDKAHPVK